MIYDIYVISNSDLFREGLNAIASFCKLGSDSDTAFGIWTWIGSAIGIILTAMAYVKQRDVMVYLKWLAMYSFVFTILLGAPVTVAIHNTSDQTVPALTVDNVPFGVALPAHLITTLGYTFTSNLETVFALPKEAQYHKTGMLFGSNLFRLSLASQLDDPELMRSMNSYIKNCVIGDILINHKYTFKEVLTSEDLWGLISSQPSPIRGLYIDGHFKTCREVATLLTTKMNEYAGTRAPNVLARFIPTRNTYAGAAVGRLLASSYEFFRGVSKTATDILRQNIAINAFRAGLKNYAAETGAVARMEIISSTMAMNNMRMAWATSRHIGIQTLPLMQVVLLLLLLCLFPLIAILTLVPGMGFTVFKNYLYSLLWLETWPMMYAILNMAMNFYTRGTNPNAVTLSNINQLALQHSDIAGIAGYLVLAIPFLSLGIVKGMAFTFNNAAQYLGGMAHSIAQSHATSVATGNYSLGNVSTDNATANNLNANKHDTNFTSMHGLDTQQLGNGTTVTDTPTGNHVYNITPGMSQLATNVHVAEKMETSYSKQAEKSLSSANKHSTEYLKSEAHNRVLGTTATSSENAHLSQSVQTYHDLTSSLMKKEGITENQAYHKLSRAYASVEAHASGSIGLGRYGSVGGSIKGGATGEASSTHDKNYSQSVDKNISVNDALKFGEAKQTIKNYARTHQYSDQNTKAENQGIQMGADLIDADRYSGLAQFTKSHSASIDTNYSQSRVEYGHSHYPSEATEMFSATSDSKWINRQRNVDDEHMSIFKKQLESYYADAQNKLSSSIPQDRKKYVVQNYQRHSQQLQNNHNKLGIRDSEVKKVMGDVDKHLNATHHDIEKSKKDQLHRQSQQIASATNEIEKGKRDAQKGVASHLLSSVKKIVKD